MPTYEYACTDCGRRTELVQSFSDPPLEVCPQCGGRVKRVFHPVGIVLKGSGFYSTDHRGSRKGATKEREKEPAKADSSPSTSEGTSKSEPKPKSAGSSETS